MCYLFLSFISQVVVLFGPEGRRSTTAGWIASVAPTANTTHLLLWRNWRTPKFVEFVAVRHCGARHVSPALLRAAARFDLSVGVKTMPVEPNNLFRQWKLQSELCGDLERGLYSFSRIGNFPSSERTCAVGYKFRLAKPEDQWQRAKLRSGSSDLYLCSEPRRHLPRRCQLSTTSDGHFRTLCFILLTTGLLCRAAGDSVPIKLSMALFDFEALIHTASPWVTLLNLGFFRQILVPVFCFFLTLPCEGGGRSVGSSIFPSKFEFEVALASWTPSSCLRLAVVSWRRVLSTSKVSSWVCAAFHCLGRVDARVVLPLALLCDGQHGRLFSSVEVLAARGFFAGSALRLRSAGRIASLAFSLGLACSTLRSAVSLQGFRASAATSAASSQFSFAACHVDDEKDFPLPD